MPKRYRPYLTAALALALCACAQKPGKPDDAIKAAETAISRADDARASDYANQDMRSAEGKLTAARAMWAKAQQDKNDQESLKARWLADEASADAELAIARAREIRTKGVVREMESRSGGGS